MIKLVLKCGDIDVEYEGPEEFLKEELPKLLKAVSDLRSAGTARKQASSETLKGGADAEASVSTLAQRLSVSNGPDLIVAAALSLVRSGIESFDRKQLRVKMRAAKTFFKATYANNFDNYLARLVKNGRLNHSGGDNYALPKNEQTALETRLVAS
jgi:hypothetical protein